MKTNNTKQKYLLLSVLLFLTVLVYGQNNKLKNKQSDSTEIIFKDTLFNIAFDSVFNNLGIIIPAENVRMVKHFKYLGSDTISIVRAWTNDPHYICKYPMESLIPNKIYSFTVCFSHQNKQGVTKKTMGFNLSTGEKIVFTFIGEYAPLNKE